MLSFKGKRLELRPLLLSDAKHLAQILNNKKIWDNVRDFMPHPYFEADAIAFITKISNTYPPRVLAIIIDGQIAGAIGNEEKFDIYRMNVEIGYWLAEPLWGKGYMSEAIPLFVDYVFTNFKIERIYAEVYEHNIGSMKALTRAGFRTEGILKNSIIKNNKIMSSHVFGLLREEWESRKP